MNIESNPEDYSPDKTLMYFQIFLVVIGIFLSVAILNANATASDSLIVTITNGITTSSSIMIAGVGILLTYSHSSALLNFQLIKRRLYFMVALMVFSAISIFGTYFYLMVSEYTKALKLGMIGLLLSFLNLFAFAALISRRLLKS
jgi:hypothetical protein